MKKFFLDDKPIVGIVAGLGSLVLSASLVWLALALLGMPLMENIRWFALTFVPLAVIVRCYAKSQKHARVLKTLLSILFVSFVAFMFLFLNQPNAIQ